MVVVEGTSVDVVSRHRFWSRAGNTGKTGINAVISGKRSSAVSEALISREAIIVLVAAGRTHQRAHGMHSSDALGIQVHVYDSSVGINYGRMMDTNGHSLTISVFLVAFVGK